MNVVRFRWPVLSLNGLRCVATQSDYISTNYTARLASVHAKHNHSLNGEQPTIRRYANRPASLNGETNALGTDVELEVTLVRLVTWFSCTIQCRKIQTAVAAVQAFEVDLRFLAGRLEPTVAEIIER